ncbi:NAD(P)-dependent oxidoreductase [Furfurilactobacillus entadae]|uniref:NAD(P)-dependent oxidoreductase n=1 Tax=Furfurilactobacillus entadae TaxID=2922307 RepID=UPI0035E48524
MKIGIIGATGKQGNLLLHEAVNRHIDVVAIVRDHSKLTLDVPYLERDLVDLSTDDIGDLDVLVSAFGAPVGKADEYPLVMQHLIDITTHTSIRLMVVGGAGSLFTDSNKTMRRYDAADFPVVVRPISVSMGSALTLLQKSDDLHWTYISPADNFKFEGKKTGRYKLGGDVMVFDTDGKSEISYADYAAAFMDELQQPQHLNEHISVVSA